ncbi:MAG: M23 family metallopeptidase [Proteobacteria bacterium]|nr:M23 family metallopeptidase [Pseudomonadota bacterium]
MKRITIMIIPDGCRATRQLRIPEALVKITFGLSLVALCAAGFVFFDYLELRYFRNNFRLVASENEDLKGEARLLMQNLEEVKGALRRVQDYTGKLGELTALKVQKFTKKTGIGPLTAEEFSVAQQSTAVVATKDSSAYVPVGLNVDKLVFRPIFDRLASIGHAANNHAMELQHLLSTLSQQKNLLSSIPSVAPVDGWITSGFGTRVSPFTGERTAHAGIDIAAPVGTPIMAPADGVVIFTGAKAGFGNFIMIAHGYGVVTRYGHNHQNLVQPGQKVGRGEQIGTVGETGRATGPHLHYEVVINGKLENPQKFILDMADIYRIY